jgi:hypothetical protein
MFFEEHPWLLVPLIIATVEVWSLVKQTVRGRLQSRKGDAA